MTQNTTIKQVQSPSPGEPATSTLSWIAASAGLAVIGVIFHGGAPKAPPSVYNSFCVDEQGGLYSVGAHHRFHSHETLFECSATGWVAKYKTACEQGTMISTGASPAVSTANDQSQETALTEKPIGH
jgi:hypothetical protein